MDETNGDTAASTDAEPADEYVSDESQFGDLDDVLVSRDGDGEIIKQKRTIRKVEWVFTPMVFGDAQKYFGDGTQFDVESEAIARLFDRFIDSMNGHDPADVADHRAKKTGREARGRVTREFIEGEFLPPAVGDLMSALLEVSGVDAEVEMDGYNASVEMREGNGQS